MRITCAGITDVGVVRSGNEDSFLLDCAHGLFIVADGMGGHAAGEVASEMAVDIVAKELGSLRGLPDGEAASRMRNAIRKANGAIFERTISEHEKRGMGTTASRSRAKRRSHPGPRSRSAGCGSCSSPATRRPRRSRARW